MIEIILLYIILRFERNVLEYCKWCARVYTRTTHVWIPYVHIGFMADSRGNNLSSYRLFASEIQLRSFPLSTNEFSIITACRDSWHRSIGVHCLDLQ